MLWTKGGIRKIRGWWWSNGDSEVRNTGFLCLMIDETIKSIWHWLASGSSSLNLSMRGILLYGVPESDIDGLLKQPRGSLSKNYIIPINSSLSSILNL